MPQLWSTSPEFLPATAGAPFTAPAVREKRGAGPGCVTPNASRKWSSDMYIVAFAVETFCPAKDGVSAARIEEEVVLTPDGAKVITLFPAQELPIANKY